MNQAIAAFLGLVIHGPWQLRGRRGWTITGFSSLQNHQQQARP